MSEGRRGGERRQHAPQSVCTQSHARIDACEFRGRVLRSVLRPVHVNPHYASPAKVDDGGADKLASRLGKLGQLRGTNTGAGLTDVARLAAPHRRRKAEGVRC
jgi:hypothetical protein